MIKRPLLILACCVLATVATYIIKSCSGTPVEAKEFKNVEVPVVDKFELQSNPHGIDFESICKDVMSHRLSEADIPEAEISREEMISDITTIWEIFFKDNGTGPGDIRRKYFEQNAGFLADAILMYQNEPTDIGGKLPIHYSTHYLLATAITLESSVDKEVSEGDLGEIGMLQVHGKALAGYDPEVVKRNTRLGILLGVRWLAAHVPKCYPEGYDEWNSHMWLGPMSLYAAGDKGYRKDGKCKKIDAARKRVDLFRMYRPRALYLQESEE
jgi:hypothetical protein